MGNDEKKLVFMGYKYLVCLNNTKMYNKLIFENFSFFFV